ADRCRCEEQSSSHCRTGFRVFLFAHLITVTALPRRQYEVSANPASAHDQPSPVSRRVPPERSVAQLEVLALPLPGPLRPRPPDDDPRRRPRLGASTMRTSLRGRPGRPPETKSQKASSMAGNWRVRRRGPVVRSLPRRASSPNHGCLETVVLRTWFTALAAA